MSDIDHVDRVTRIYDLYRDVETHKCKVSSSL